MSWPLLKTKLQIPPPRPQLVSRPRLMQRLEDSRTHKLTLVCAPAGYGKTTILSQWARTCRRPVAWFSVDPEDNDPTHFWTYFISALSGLDRAPGHAALRTLRSSTQTSIETVLAVLINEVTLRKKRCTLVIDDYHQVTNRLIHRAVAYLLEHLPPQIHLILSTRVSPELPLSRLRVRGELNELLVPDLRFSPSETADFLNRHMGLELSSDQVAKLDDRTEGWIAGLQLAAISMRGRTDLCGFIESFGGTQEYILKYLLEEVLNRQPERIQSFMLQTSIVDRMNASLCAHLTGMDQSADMLERLEAENLFVFPLDTERKWYRYHLLFQEALQNRLQRIHPHHVPDLHHRASSWFEYNGYPNDAIHHAFRGDHLDRAADLIEKHCLPTLHRGETTTFLNWLKRLPEDMIRARPMICVGHAYATFMDPSAGPYQIVEQRLHDAERIVLTHIHKQVKKRSRDPSYYDQITGYIAGIRAYLARERRDPPESIIELSHRALDNLRENNPVARSLIKMNLGMAYRTLGDAQSASSALEESRQLGISCDLPFAAVYSTYLLAQIARLQGRLTDARDISLETLRLYDMDHERSSQPLPVTGALYVGLGTVLLEQDERAEAGRNLVRGVELLRITRDVDALLNGYAGLVRLGIAEGKSFNELIKWIEQMEQYGPEGLLLGAALRIRLLVLQAEENPDCLSAAAFVAQKHGVDLRGEEEASGIDHTAQRRHALRLALVRLFISQRRMFSGTPGQLDLESVLVFLDRMYRQAQDQGLARRMIETKILESLARRARGEGDGALAPLEQALSLAKEEGFARIFFDEGDPMAELLHKAVAKGIHQEYSTKLLVSMRSEKRKAGRGRSRPKPPSPLVDPISDREMEVLRLIAAGLSNREIASELFLALGTIKKHVNNIYTKLNVHKRTQAVARARELSLL